VDKAPTILFRYKNGSIVQSNDGGLVSSDMFWNQFINLFWKCSLDCIPWNNTPYGVPLDKKVWKATLGCIQYPQVYKWEEWPIDILRLFTISVSFRDRVYAEGWTEDSGRDNQLEYRITIDNAQEEDSGTYSVSKTDMYIVCENIKTKH